MDRPVCTNGHELDEYPDTFRDCLRIGINASGHVEYVNESEQIVYEAVYPVGETDNFAQLRQHDMLGVTFDEHISVSEQRFGEWRHIELW